MNSMEEHWDRWRSQVWLPENVVPLNAGTCSPTPRPVFDLMTQLRQKMAADPQDFIWSAALPNIEKGRRALAEFLRCEATQLVFQQNVSFAMNGILQSLDFSPGDEIVMSDQEYHHFEALWRRLQKKRGLIIHKVHLPLPTEIGGGASPAQAEEVDAAIVDAFARQLNRQTKVVFFSHVTSATGMVLPAKGICARARAAGVLTIVDGAHAAGMVDVDVTSIDADFYCGTAHKWLMGPVGTGYMWVSRDRRLQLRPLVTTAAWEYDRADCDREGLGGGTYWQRSLEYQGTQDRVAQAALWKSFAFTSGIGWENMRQRMSELQAYSRDAIQGVGFKLLSLGGAQGTAMSSFAIPAIDQAKAHNWFYGRAGMELAFTHLSGVGPVMRVSTSWFNRREEIDALVKVLPTVPWAELAPK